ncbi:LptF/LptG family permease, partial [Hydrogenophaga borbori]|uniref:LptF/LptG family permease n=1 Tax=Hydrogenophaga borbori TaxID=2294117 RepID=UPI00301D4FEC
MKTIRRLIYGEVFAAVFFVLLAFLSLFFFFDFVDELPDIGKASVLDPTRVYGLPDALLYVGLLTPSRIYELLPIAVLIGSVFVLARLAQGSEYTILRTSGLGPWRALRTMLGLGAVFVLLTFAIGDYLAPLADRGAQLHKARFQGAISLGQTGAWLKEKQPYSNFSVNVGSMSPQGDLGNVRIFEFNNQGFLVSTLHAQSGRIEADESWTLRKVERREFDAAGQQSAKVQRSTLESFRWPTSLNAEMVSVALLKPERMRTADLFAYIRHLEANGIPTVVIGTARDIVEHCGVARFLHTDFPLGNPCGEPWLVEQQQAILERAFRLLETATGPRTTEQSPFQWRAGDDWKARVFTPEQPFHSPESREN